MWVRGLVTALLAVLVAAPADAAPGPIDPVELFASERVDGATVGTAPDGSGVIIFDNETDSPLELGAHGRTAEGGYGPFQELTTDSSAERPPEISFDATGRGFAAWSDAQAVRMPPGGLFGPATPLSFCGRFLRYDTAPDGTVHLLCTAQAGTPPNDYIVRYAEQAPGADAFGSPDDISGAGINDPFMRPRIDVGDDGTVARGWSEWVVGGQSKLEVSVRPPGGSFDDETLEDVTDPDFASLDDIAVLPDGTALALYITTAGLQLDTRSPGPAGTWSGPVIVDAVGESGHIAVDAAGQATLAWNHPTGTGMGAPQTVQVKVRTPGGSLGPTADIETGSINLVGLDVAPDGTAALLWRRFAGGSSTMVGALRTPGGGSFGTPMVVATGLPNSASPDFAIEPGGNVLAAWVTEPEEDDNRLLAGGIDNGTGPALRSLSVPDTAAPGETVSLSVDPVDWSGLREVRWTLPGGATPTGASVSHTFVSTGTFDVSVTAVDRAGNASSATRSVRVGEDDTVSPVLRKLGLRPRAFRAARRGRSIAAAAGARVSYRVSEGGRVRFTVQRAAKGRRVGRRCRKPTRRNAGRRPCRRFVRVRGAFTHAGRTGTNRFRFTGRLRRRPLGRGRYRLVAVASDPAGNRSKARRAPFRILAPARKR